MCLLVLLPARTLTSWASVQLECFLGDARPCPLHLRQKLSREVHGSYCCCTASLGDRCAHYVGLPCASGSPECRMCCSRLCPWQFRTLAALCFRYEPGCHSLGRAKCCSQGRNDSCADTSIVRLGLGFHGSCLVMQKRRDEEMHWLVPGTLKVCGYLC